MFIDRNEFITFLRDEGEGAGGAAGAGDAGDKGAAAAGAGDAGAAGDKGKEKVIFSKEQQDYVNKLLADNKRGLRAELEKTNLTLAEKETMLNELVESHNEVLEFIKGISEPGEEGKKPIINMDSNRDLKDIIKDMGGKLQEFAEKEETWEQRFGELEGKHETEIALREIAEEESLIAERDSLVQRALIKAGCSDIKTALKLFEDNIEVDEQTGQWFVVNDETGEDWPLGEGVEKLLPDYMKKPLTERQGAGSSGSRAAMQSELQANKSKLTTLDEEITGLKAEYGKNPSSTLLSKVQQKARARNQIARDLRSAQV